MTWTSRSRSPEASRQLQGFRGVGDARRELFLAEREDRQGSQGVGAGRVVAERLRQAEPGGEPFVDDLVAVEVQGQFAVQDQGAGPERRGQLVGAAASRADRKAAPSAHRSNASQ